MDIHIDDIPEEGLFVDATESDKWLSEVAATMFGATFEAGDHIKVHVEIHKFNENINMDGEIKVSYHPDCDRCLTHYGKDSVIPFHTILSPLAQGKWDKTDEEAEKELVKEDLEFVFYEGDSFDLAEIVTEQIVLTRPMKEVCKEDCKGLCQHCGKDLNEGPCGCVQKAEDPRWEALKQFKTKKTAK